MEQSFFMNKAEQPGSKDLEKAMGALYSTWLDLSKFVKAQHGTCFEEWNFSKAGWNCRIKDNKRVIVYLMPGDRQFKASFVFGQKATTQALGSEISPGIKQLIETSKVYAEGRGVRIVVDNKNMLQDLEKLAAIKLAY